MKIKGSKFFTKFDLEKGFYQLEIAEQDKWKTAFSTPFGKFEFNRIPFGLTNAQKFFNAVITRILQSVPNAIVFIDDILVYDKDESSHLRSIKKVLSLLQESNVILNLEKIRNYD